VIQFVIDDELFLETHGNSWKKYLLCYLQKETYKEKRRIAERNK